MFAVSLKCEETLQYYLRQKEISSQLSQQHQAQVIVGENY